MALVESICASELENLVPASTEAAAITNLTDSYEAYILGTNDSVSPVPGCVSGLDGAVTINAAAVTVAKAAMAAALVGMSASGAGLTKIPAAVTAFWASIAAQLTASFAAVLAIVPPPHSTFAADFAATAATNTSGGLNLSAAMAALAGDFHSGATALGTGLFPPPPAGTLYPIL